MKTTALYRLFDAADVLLYVGVSINLGARWRTHSGEKVDWGLVARATVEHLPGRQAFAAERAAIKAERPLWNIVHNRPLPPCPELPPVADAGPVVDASEEVRGRIVEAFAAIAVAEGQYRAVLQGKLANGTVQQVDVAKALDRTREMIRRDAMPEDQREKLRARETERRRAQRAQASRVGKAKPNRNPPP